MDVLNICSRSEAIAAGKKVYFTGKPCSNGHIALRSVLNYGCVECIKNIRKDYYSRNKVRTKEARKQWYMKNREHEIKSVIDRYNNSDEYKRRNYYRSRLRKQHINGKATPLWVDMNAVNKIYEKRDYFNNIAGQYLFVVDHIVPLKSNFVCGLHTEHNLRVVHRSKNGRKLNRSWPNV